MFANVTAQNERLAATLREAREQIVTLKEEVDRLAQPPASFGIFISANDDDSIDMDRLRPGQEVMLNESFNVVRALSYEQVGEVVMLKELLEDGDRALVIG